MQLSQIILLNLNQVNHFSKILSTLKYDKHLIGKLIYKAVFAIFIYFFSITGLKFLHHTGIKNMTSLAFEDLLRKLSSEMAKYYNNLFSIIIFFHLAQD